MMNRGGLGERRDERRERGERRDETREMAMTSIERARRRARRSCETVDGSDRSIARDRGVGSGDGSGLELCVPTREGGGVGAGGDRWCIEWRGGRVID